MRKILFSCIGLLVFGFCVGLLAADLSYLTVAPKGLLADFSTYELESEFLKADTHDYLKFRSELRKTVQKLLMPGEPSSLVERMTAAIKKSSTSILSEPDFNVGQNHMRCRKTSHDAYVCLFFNKYHMNAAMSRVNAFSCGGFGLEVGEVASTNCASMHFLNAFVSGHRIHAKYFLEFYNSIRDRGLKLTSQELLFANIFKELYDQHGTADFSVIAVESGTGDASFVSHEIDHVRWDHEPGYRGVVKEFWAEGLEEQERRSLKETLGKIGYDVEDLTQLQKEFSAFILMQNAANNALGPYVLSLQTRYREYLVSKGFELLFVE